MNVSLVLIGAIPSHDGRDSRQRRCTCLDTLLNCAWKGLVALGTGEIQSSLHCVWPVPTILSVLGCEKVANAVSSENTPKHNLVFRVYDGVFDERQAANIQWGFADERRGQTQIGMLY